MPAVVDVQLASRRYKTGSSLSVHKHTKEELDETKLQNIIT